nr:4Fe-4S binding protein [uncultured Blautia sp.]
MACTISAEEIKRVKALGFLNNKGTDLFNGRVITVNGKITAAQAKVIAEAAEKFGNGDVEFTTRLTVEVRGIHFNDIEAFREYIAQAGLQTGGTGSVVRPVVSCKGTTCQYGLYDTFALSEKIHERFYLGYRTVKLPHKFKIATGGCPNNCVKPDLNDLGIVGQLVPNFDEDMCNGCKKCKIEKTCPMKAAKVEDGVLEIDKDICNNCGRCVGNCPFDAIEEGTPGYKIYIGGRWGKKVAQGQALSKIFTSEEEVLDVVEKAILLFREQGNTGERFADTIARIGFENVEKQLLSNEILERKQEILDAKLHLAGGASC